MNEFNIYCDESCYLEHDGINVMVLGAVWCPKEMRKKVTKDLLAIKARYGLSHQSEIKWTKISSNHFQMYHDWVDYFFSSPYLNFRGIVIPDKTILNHSDYKQDHDEWYYKMFFVLLNPILDPKSSYSISFDYRDTHGNERIKKLQEVLCNNKYDFNKEIIKSVQLVRSHQVELIQLTDLMTGALSYYHRHLDGNFGKKAIIEQIKLRSGYSLDMSTLLREQKFNILVWHPRNGGGMY